MNYSINSGEIVKLIEADGWILIRSKGSHRQYKHQTKPGTVTVPFHGPKSTPPKKTVKSILKQAGII